MDGDSNIVGIKIQNANAGYVTLGYGFIIQTEADAKKYGFRTWTKQEINVIEQEIDEQARKYGTGAGNPAVLSQDEAEELLKEELDKWYEEAESLCKKYNPAYTADQLNAVTCNIYNAGTKHKDDPDSLQYYLLRNDKEGAMDILHKADDNNWYGENGGLLRRRLLEYNIYFNGNYKFYDDSELEQLKSDTGFTQ